MMMYRKVFVDVNADISKEGQIRPRTIKWIEPNGDERIYRIDRLRHICPAASLKVGGCGMRYTVVICGKETYLFNEDGKWFVEATARKED